MSEDQSSGSVHAAWRGTAHPFSKLNDGSVREIRRRHADGESYRKLAARFGVTDQTIRSVVLRKSWKHVE